MKMRNYTYYIVATILFFIGVASIQAQTLQAVVTETEQVVFHENSWHVLTGTNVTVTLSGVTVPASTEEKRYENTLIYKKEGQTLQNGTDIFPISQNLTVNYTAVATYQRYKKEEETGEWIPDGNPQEETIGTATVVFKAYNVPNLDDLNVKSTVDYTYETANSVTFTANYSYNPEANGLTYKIEWKKNATLVKSGTDNTYDLSTDEIGEPTIEATLTVYAPNKTTIWATKSANKTITIFNKPTVGELILDRKYALKGDPSFYVEVKATSDAGITPTVTWSGGVTGTELKGSFNPNTVGTFLVAATVKFEDPDGNELLTIPSEQKTITVYNVPQFTGITPDKNYAWVGDNAFNVKADVNSDEGIIVEVTWGGALTGNGETKTFIPQTKGTFPISATVTFKDPEGNLLINGQPKTSEIIVYNKPTVDDLILDRKYALKGDPSFYVEVKVTNDPEITPTVTWSDGVTGTGTELKGSFNPNTVGSFPVSATVKFEDSDGNELLAIPSEQKTITVYNVPQFTGITPDKNYALVGDNAFNVKADVNSDEGIIVEVTWGGALTGNGETQTFIPQTKGTFPIIATVTFKDPEGNLLINGQPKTSEITVYNRPVVNGIKLPNDADFVYSGSETEITFDVDNLDDDLKPYVQVQWQTSRGTITPQDGINTTYTAPSNLTDDEQVTLRATITVKDPGNNQLMRESSTKTITIFAMALNPNKLVTYIDDPDFSIILEGFNTSSGNYELRPQTDWCSEVKEIDELTGNLNKSAINIPDDQDFIKINITATVQTEALYNGNWTPVGDPYTLKPVEITVYKTPVIKSVNVTPDSHYSCVENERTLTATVEYEPKSLPVKYEWYDLNGNTLETVEESNNKTDNGATIRVKYTPNSVNTAGTQINANIQVWSPEGIDEPWSEKKTADTPLALTVYEQPSVAVNEDMIKAVIVEPETDPDKIVGYEGQKDGENDKSFTYSTNGKPNNNYGWSYIWELYKDGEENEPFRTSETGTFEALPEGTYTVKVNAQAMNPDKNSEEAWGKAIPYTLEHPIKIYIAPQYQEQNYHLKESSEHIYSSYIDKPFDASKLFSYVNENGKVTGYPTGWEKKLYVNETENKDNNGNSSLTFIPEVAGDYSLRLEVKNNAPTGIWYDSESNGNPDDYKYTLHVYNTPEIESNNLSSLFDGPDEQGKYALHVESGKEVPFEFTIKGGDMDKENSKWEITRKIDEDDPVSFTKNGSKHTYTFQESNDSDVKNEYSFIITVSDELDYLVKDQEPFHKEFSGTITVWKEITATMAAPTTDNDGNYVLETRVGDSDKQEIKIRLVGGDPEKWIITPTTNGSPGGSGNKDGYDYTYTIQDTDFTTDNTYSYSFTAKYKDGLTDIPGIEKQVSIIAWPMPEIDQVLALNNDNKNVKYIEQSGSYNITCYESDKLGMTVTPTGGKTNEKWKYQVGTGSKTDLPSNGKINVNGNGTNTIKFYNYLGTKEKEVKTIGTQITRKSDPEITNVLPTVDNTTAEIWNAAKNAANRVDLYGDASKPQFSKADFNFSPQSGHEGYENGWNYSWSIDGTEQSKNYGQWSYTATNTSNNAYEDKTISVSIKNSIPAGSGQDGENVGLSDTKTYYVRVWHEAILPSENYTLTDEYNNSNDVKTTHAIREGNKMTANVAPIVYGYSNNNFYEWKGQGAQANKANWETELSNSDPSNNPGKSMTTYGLHVYNKGPRGTIWAEKSFPDCDVDIYNKPKTPSSLVIKGQGSQAGTSGTVIVEYADISDTELINRGDYVIDFCYTDTNGDKVIIAKPQTKQGDIRWATGYSSAQMQTAFAYSHWLDETNGVLITSGKRTINGVDETFDLSRYNLSSSEVTEIRDITRAGSGDYEDIIHSIDSNEITEGNISVYNMSGMKVGSSMQGLTPGMYIIRYQQDGVTKSKKLSVK
jgi:hypothetical protein